MPYRLDLDDLPSAFASLVRREVKRIAHYSHLDPDARQETAAVHDLRKSVKRLRAVLRLADGATDEASLHGLDRHIRKLGRWYAPARDQAVTSTLLDDLISDGTIKSKILAGKLKAACVVEVAPAGTIDFDIDDTMRRFDALTFQTATLETVVRSASRAYKRARHGRGRAERAGTSDAFHDWRKLVQRHARHMQLLADLWPEEMQVRLETAKELSDVLGEEHDFSGLDRCLATIAMAPAQRRALDRVRLTIAARQAALRVSSLALGGRLFAERSRAFRGRLEAYASERDTRAATATKIDTAAPPLLVPKRQFV